MDSELTVEDALEKLTDEKAKLEDKLDKTVQKIHAELAMVEHLINIVREFQKQNTE